MGEVTYRNMHDPKVTTHSESLIQHGQLPRDCIQSVLPSVNLPLFAWLSPYQDCEAMSVRVKLHTDLQDMQGEQPESQMKSSGLSYFPQ